MDFQKDRLVLERSEHSAPNSQPHVIQQLCYETRAPVKPKPVLLVELHRVREVHNETFARASG